MKRILTLVIIAFLLSSVNAQTTSNSNSSEQYMKFRDIPIMGPITDMVKKLQALGYTLEEQESYVAIMSGTFANENCEIVLYATPKTHKMHSVLVNFKERSSWNSLKSDYLKFKELLKNKYKMTPKSSEYFVDPYYEGDGYELQALRKDKCFYFSNFNFTPGKIGLYILNNKVTIMYQDYFGKNLNKKEENEKAYDDL